MEESRVNKIIRRKRTAANKLTIQFDTTWKIRMEPHGFNFLTMRAKRHAGYSNLYAYTILYITPENFKTPFLFLFLKAL